MNQSLFYRIKNSLCPPEEPNFHQVHLSSLLVRNVKKNSTILNNFKVRIANYMILMGKVLVMVVLGGETLKNSVKHL